MTECDNMLMLIGVPVKMTEKERDVVIPLIMRGYKDCALEAGTTVTGGQTVLNPWCTVGAVWLLLSVNLMSSLFLTVL